MSGSTRPGKLVGAVTLGTAALLALSGCGGGGGTIAEPKASSSAPSTSAPEGPSGSTSGQQLFTTLTAAIVDAGSATVDLKISTGGQTISGNGVYQFRTGDEVAADLTITIPGQGELRTVILGPDVYLKLPAALAQPGRPWVKIQAGGSDPLSQSLGSVVEQLRGGLDPGDGLAAIQGATTVERTGEETVDGVETTVYAASMDLAKAAEYAEGDLKRQYEQLAASGVETLEFTLWVDGDDLLRRFRTVVPTKQGDVEAVGNYSGWGEPVTIEAPPQDQVAPTR